MHCLQSVSNYLLCSVILVTVVNSSLVMTLKMVFHLMYQSLGQRASNTHKVVLDGITDIQYQSSVKQLPRGSAAACTNPPALQSSEAAAAAAASPALIRILRPRKVECMNITIES